ncbi:hypothetical protein IE53DRAFT_387567 [Violaceomyces palustris]|uniref:Uncharacterized protein n=1 Tax=Violaceomyces palustris TaxID=1673888 RepID=A0ACD0NWF0_9BASI|nr:hypothetical protein IE53DRAFT_387567 [Violaceomyces palustris]
MASTTTAPSSLASHSPSNSHPSSDTSRPQAGEGENTTQPPLVMQIIVDRQLVKSPDWKTGPLMVQSAHAAVAVITKTLARSKNTRDYVSEANLEKMHKVVLQLPAKVDLESFSRTLREAKQATMSSGKEEFPDHHLWIEQPEGLPTCLALEPNRKPAALVKVLKKCSLLRD